MSEVWKRMIQGWLDSYDSIKVLAKNGILDIEEHEDDELMQKLLEEIIETFRSEVE